MALDFSQDPGLDYSQWSSNADDGTGQTGYPSGSSFGSSYSGPPSQSGSGFGYSPSRSTPSTGQAFVDPSPYDGSGYSQNGGSDIWARINGTASSPPSPWPSDYPDATPSSMSMTQSYPAVPPASSAGPRFASYNPANGVGGRAVDYSAGSKQSTRPRVGGVDNSNSVVARYQAAHNALGGQTDGYSQSGYAGSRGYGSRQTGQLARSLVAQTASNGDLPPTLTDDINRFGQSPTNRQPIGNPATGISSATFVDPRTGQLQTYFYGGNGDGRMYGRRLSPSDPRVKAAVAGQPALRNGALPTQVLNQTKSSGPVRHFDPFDPKSGTYRYAFKNGNVVFYDRNFNPVAVPKSTGPAPSMWDANILGPAALDSASQVQSGIKTGFDWLANRGADFVSDAVHESDDPTLIGSKPSPVSPSQRQFGQMTAGNTIRGMGNAAAGAPDFVTGVMDTASKELATGVLKVRAAVERAAGNPRAAQSDDALRQQLNNEIAGTFEKLVQSTAEGFGAAGPDTPRGYVSPYQSLGEAMHAFVRKDPKAAEQFLNDALSTTGENIIKDPFAAATNLMMVHGMASATGMAEASARGAMMNRLANGLDRAADAVEATDPAAAAAARRKVQDLRQAQGRIAQARAAYSMQQKKLPKVASTSTISTKINPDVSAKAGAFAIKPGGVVEGTPAKTPQTMSKAPPSTLATADPRAAAKAGARTVYGLSWENPDYYGLIASGRAQPEVDPFVSNSRPNGPRPTPPVDRSVLPPWRSIFDDVDLDTKPGKAGANLGGRAKAQDVPPTTSSPDASVPPAKPTAYSVAVETQLAPTRFGRSRPTQFRDSNAAFYKILVADPDLAGMFERLIPGVTFHLEKHSSAPPQGWTWEHASTSTAGGRSGIMRLVPREQHTPGSRWWRILHPDRGACGGYSEWAIPKGAPKNRKR